MFYQYFIVISLFNTHSFLSPFCSIISFLTFCSIISFLTRFQFSNDETWAPRQTFQVTVNVIVIVGDFIMVVIVVVIAIVVVITMNII